MPYRRARPWLIAALVFGAALRLFWIAHYSIVAGDSLLYADIAQSWRQHGIYGFAQADGPPLPTLIRLPGYPLFLVLCFQLFGASNFHAVTEIQLIVDLLACVLLGVLAHRLFGPRAATVAFAAAALCPFTAAYVAVPLTETLTCATVTAAFYALLRWRESSADVSPSSAPWNRWILWLAASLGFSILLRPDQVLLAVAILPAMLYPTSPNRAPTRSSGAGSKRLNLVATCRLLPALAATALTLTPLVPWTVRNARTFRIFEPLAPRSASDPGEAVPTGFYRWYRTWAVEYGSTEDVYWNYDGATIQPADLPNRAVDSPAQFAETVAILADYNLTRKPSPELDDRFDRLALARIHAHPLRYYIALPVARLANMLLRPRTEALPIPLSWWRFHEHPGATIFAVAYAALNFAWLSAGLLGLVRWSQLRGDPTRILAWSMLAYIALRCTLLLTLDNSEPRYTVEFFPLLTLGIAALTRPRNAAVTAGRTSSSYPS